jgi:hypothetical protein
LLLSALSLNALSGDNCGILLICGLTSAVLYCIGPPPFVAGAEKEAAPT